MHKIYCNTVHTHIYTYPVLHFKHIVVLNLLTNYLLGDAYIVEAKPKTKLYEYTYFYLLYK